MIRITASAGAAVFILGVAALHAAEPQPPRVELVEETIQGVTVRDPYRWMEGGGAEFDAWAKAESAHARVMLDAIPGHAALRERITELDQPSGAITGLQVRGDRWLYGRADDEGTTRTYVRRGHDGPERVVDFLGALPSSEGPWSEVGAARVLSPNGRYITFGTTQRGEENPTLRIFDLRANSLLPDTITWPLWADSNGFRPRWLADSSGFLYVRRPDVSAAMDNTARARRGQIFIHRLGTPVTSDRPIFGYGLTPEIAETDTLYVQGEPHPNWLGIWRRKASGLETWVLDLTKLSDEALPPARRISSSDVRVPGYGIRGNSLYTADSTYAPRFRIVRFDLTQSDPKPEIVLAEQEGVLTGIVVAKDAVYAVESLLSRSRLHVIDDRGGRAIDLEAGVVDSLEPGPEGRGAWITQVDWLMPKRGKILDAGADRLRPSGLDSISAPAPRAISELRWAPARDGESIPFTIVHSGAPSASPAYVLMDGYGCFGSVNTPFYWPALEALVERGGAYVQVAMRGGGELGADWHRAGRDRNKPTSFEDAIDVAKHLVRTGVTTPGRIAVRGGSCGGMTMGMAALEAPHLIGAAILSVGAFDLLRMANHSAAGARSIRDIGDPATEDGTRRIVALSPFYQVLDGAPRPAMLIGSGATDYAIPLWVGGKMVARMRAAAPEGRPVLWDIKWEAGHNAGVDYVQLDTDEFAFTLWQLGHPQFQP